MEKEDVNLTQKDLDQKNKFEELYKQQQQERLENKQKKKQLDEETKDPKEKMLVIQKEFKEKQESLSLKIKNCKKDGLNINDLFDEFKSIKEYFISTNHALTTYDKQQYKDQLDKLEKHLFVLKDMLCPRKKFKFSQRIKKDKQTENKENKKEEQQMTQPKIDYVEQVPGISDKENQKIILGKDQVQSSYKLYNLKNCEESGFQGKENQWREIQDFNWLKQEKSPNFTLVD
ncbi:hypothetical protein PPERSA_00687 [Pseudocohnilembus persalinus]|uniref:Tubulin-specific chaperone C N-terminal domain-containing protein n=1 Tax=Pseudocohnilembus persalinus TaxID=266149 RepID=A0A0V0QTR9_PSEPJ|nr:hypothetical protein PPERSA_00687 [Pseudocohnilembus persalinus]|eukprot:KRX05386.1 hypothetical protein PPERSA_00687 [Pseudocohnilembus persalinus]